MSTSSLSPVTFHGDTLHIIEQNGEPFTPMKPIVENMGLDWSSQYTKIKANSARWATMAIITTVQDGKERETLCMPVRKLPAFFASINPKKVREELRERIYLYQDECDNALWDYWTKGQATRKAKKPAQKALPKAEQKELPAQRLTIEEDIQLFAEEVRQAHAQVYAVQELASEKLVARTVEIMDRLTSRASDKLGPMYIGKICAVATELLPHVVVKTREALRSPYEHLSPYDDPAKLLTSCVKLESRW